MQFMKSISDFFKFESHSKLKEIQSEIFIQYKNLNKLNDMFIINDPDIINMYYNNYSQCITNIKLLSESASIYLNDKVKSSKTDFEFISFLTTTPLNLSFIKGNIIIINNITDIKDLQLPSNSYFDIEQENFDDQIYDFKNNIKISYINIIQSLNNIDNLKLKFYIEYKNLYNLQHTILSKKYLDKMTTIFKAKIWKELIRQSPKLEASARIIDFSVFEIIQILIILNKMKIELDNSRNHGIIFKKTYIYDNALPRNVIYAIKQLVFSDNIILINEGINDKHKDEHHYKL